MVELPAVGISLAMTEIYDGLEFEAAFTALEP